MTYDPKHNMVVQHFFLIYVTTFSFIVYDFLGVVVLFLPSLDGTAIVAVTHTVYFNTNPRIPSKREGGVIVTVIPWDP